MPGVAVVRRLGGHIGKVDTLSKHVSVHWSLGWGDSETLAKNSTEVCTARSMPQETAVAVLDTGEAGGLEAIFFALALDLKDVNDLDLVSMGYDSRRW